MAYAGTSKVNISAPILSLTARDRGFFVCWSGVRDGLLEPLGELHPNTFERVWFEMPESQRARVRNAFRQHEQILEQVAPRPEGPTFLILPTGGQQPEDRITEVPEKPLPSGMGRKRDGCAAPFALLRVA